jgi:hypothetical protein
MFESKGDFAGFGGGIDGWGRKHLPKNGEAEGTRSYRVHQAASVRKTE